MSTVVATGISLQNPKAPWQIHLRHNDKAAETYFEKISGSVGSPKGKVSIQHHTECAKTGTELEFDLHWYPGKLTKDHIERIVAGMTVIGLGSCLSQGFGRIEVLSLKIP